MSKKAHNPQREKLLCQLQSIILGGIGLFLFISLATYSNDDLAHLSNPTLILNWGGKLGAFVSENLLRFTGTVSYFFPIGFFTFSWFYGRKINALLAVKKTILLILPFITALLLLHKGGFLGYSLTKLTSRFIGDFGRFIFAILLLIIFILEKLKRIMNEPLKRKKKERPQENQKELLHGDRVVFNSGHQVFSTSDDNSINISAISSRERKNIQPNEDDTFLFNNEQEDSLEVNYSESIYTETTSTRKKLLQDFKDKVTSSNKRVPLITKIIFDDSTVSHKKRKLVEKNEKQVEQQIINPAIFSNDLDYMDSNDSLISSQNGIEMFDDNDLSIISSPTNYSNGTTVDIENNFKNDTTSFQPDSSDSFMQPNRAKKNGSLNSHGKYKKPGFNLLETRSLGDQSKIKKTILENATNLERTFREFGIEVAVTDYKQGPVITRYELSIPPGIKIQKIVSLQDNIALNLAAASVRIEAPIPGKSAIGIEIPNKTRTLVSIRGILESSEFKNTDAKIPIVLGKTVSGKSKIADLSAMPHLIIAGTTGSGKSVCVNTIICSIIYKMPPKKVRFILIDPKYVELAPYNDIPHLLTPVINKPHTAITVLKWLVKEMEQRYLKLQQLNTRNITGYNEKVASGNLPSVAVANEYVYEEMPYLVVIIDELADLMILAAKEIENSISRLAAMSRAVGIHLIFATQRPSVDVITGVIKNNFPARIAFQVASSTDSRTILDKKGADKLLGKGDSLFIGPGTPYPERIQGAFLSDEEVDKTTDYLKSLGSPQYDHSILEDEEESESGGFNEDEKDVLFDEALEIVLQSNRASASYLQRKLKIGYNRAARIIEYMEDEKIIGSQQGSKPREILIN